MNRFTQNRTEDIQDAIRTLNEKLERMQSDADDGTMDVTEAVEAAFARRINSFRDYDKRPDAIAENDWEYLVLKRRKQAIAAMCREVCERYADKYPTLNIPEEWIRLCTPGSALTFNDLNNDYDVELAAAIWMLDALADSDRYEEAAAFFPKTRDELNQVYLPNLSDAVHSDDALRSAVCLIRNRNRGAEGFDGRKAFIDEADTRLKKKPADETLPDRVNFDRVISLIDRETVEKLQERFITYLWELADALMGLIARRREEYIETLKAVLGELSQLLGQDSGAGEIPALITGEAVKISSAELLKTLSDDRKVQQLMAAVEEKEADLQRLPDMIRMIPAITRGESPDDKALFEGLALPRILCPYEMCFAFLSLLCDDSDIVWNYNLSYVVLALACQALPWADSGAVDPDNSHEEIEVDYEYLASLIEKTPDWDDNGTNELMYRKQLHSPLLTPERQRISISQLTFLSSGLIPPRRGNSILFTKAILHDAQLPEEQRELLYEYFLLAYSINHKDDGYLAPEEEQDDDSSLEDAADQIKALRAEIKRLRSTVHQLKRQCKDVENQLAESKRASSDADRELAELRTMIRESADTDDSAVTVAFPYTAQKRCVIIGGHESWVKAIKPLLPDVRFISSSENPNSGVILNAEVIWIQTNALGHSGYYKIMDIVRRNRIKVCYFSFASAEKCAEQFALEDMAQNEAQPDGE